MHISEINCIRGGYNGYLFNRSSRFNAMFISTIVHHLMPFKKEINIGINMVSIKGKYTIDFLSNLVHCVNEC